MLRKDYHEEGMVFCRDAGIWSSGRRLPVAAVLESGCDVGVAKDCADESHVLALRVVVVGTGCGGPGQLNSATGIKEGGR